MSKKVTFNEVTVVYQQVLGTFFIAKKKPLTSEEDIAKRQTPFAQKRTLLKQQLHLNHLERKARRQAKRQKTE